MKKIRIKNEKILYEIISKIGKMAFIEFALDPSTYEEYYVKKK